MKSLIKKEDNGSLTREFFDTSSWFPEMNVEEKDNVVNVKANLPNIKKENIHIKLNKNILTISGEERQSKKEKSKNSYFSSSSHSSFSQSISLPENISDKNIKTKYTNGVLEINIPKTNKIISSKN